MTGRGRFQTTITLRIYRYPAYVEIITQPPPDPRAVLVPAVRGPGTVYWGGTIELSNPLCYAPGLMVETEEV